MNPIGEFRLTLYEQKVISSYDFKLPCLSLDLASHTGITSCDIFNFGNFVVGLIGIEF